jgi:hypothetical protein
MQPAFRAGELGAAPLKQVVRRFFVVACYA